MKMEENRIITFSTIKPFIFHSEHLAGVLNLFLFHACLRNVHLFFLNGKGITYLTISNALFLKVSILSPPLLKVMPFPLVFLAFSPNPLSLLI